MTPSDGTTVPPVLSISQLYDRVDAALNSTFGGKSGLWVEGEIAKISGSNGHCYVDLVDPAERGPRPSVLGGKCWKSTWGPLQRTLAAAGITLTAGMTIRFKGTVDFYRPQGKVGFVISELDVTALQGAMALQRQELIDALRRDGTIGRNASIPVPELPLRVGLIASPGTEGCADFLGQLERSGFAFEVILSPATMQGERSAPSVIQGLASLQRLADSVDLIVITRGGGAKTDLAAFDDDALARAIGASTIPVWTAIGHSGDESICDLVAGRAHITPTACGGAIVERVSLVAASVASSAAAVLRAAESVVADAVHLRERATSQLGLLASGALAREHLRLSNDVQRLVRAARARCIEAATSLGTAVRLTKTSATDTQLRRGFAIIRTETGSIVRSPEAVAIGTEISAEFATGTLTATVTGHQPLTTEEAS